MEDCIFCKIINNEIPSYKIYEDDDVLAFLDISQVTKGHTLVIPKKHAKNLYEIASEDLIKVHQVVQELTCELTEKFNAQGVNIINNNHEAAGQTVFHYHVHIIPRYDENDQLTLKFGSDSKIDPQLVFNEFNK
ncbi:HIT family protein [Erysipelotrichaceae bacterium OttesenSCG-928-M19]|nr:HIT family protein [Erysipelotrichaceae bacterium OttesenSCG-928-M19]